MSISTCKTIKLLRALSGQSNTYTIPKLYVRLTECHVRALILNQLVFYSDKSTRHKDDWFDKSYEEWEKETFVKERTLRNILTEFKKREWCESRTIKVNGKRTLLCRPRLENILKDLNTLLENDPQKPPTNSCPKRKNLPDSQPEKFAVSNTIYTDKTSDKKTTTKEKPLSSSSVLTSKQKDELLKHKLSTDERTNEIFLENCQWHVEKQTNNHTNYERVKGLIKILKGLKDTGEHFKAKGYINAEEQKAKAEQEEKKKAEFLEAQDRQHQERLAGYQKASKSPKESKPSQERKGVPTSIKSLLGMSNAYA